MAARLVIFALLGIVGVGVVAATGAQAEGRFGDSTWVAPSMPFDSEPPADGPRVARRDHERRWETALRTPFRVVFFPLRVLASGLEIGAAYVGPRFLEPKANRPPKPGPTLAPHISLGAVNDIGLGPAVTWAGFPSNGSELRLTGSWSGIDRRRVNLSQEIGAGRPVGFRLLADYDYKPNRRYYGIGNETPETDLSYYLLERTGAEAALLFGVSPLRQLRLGGGYSSMSPRRGYKGTPLLEDVFGPESAPYEHRTTQELWYGVNGDVAALDDGRNPSLGVHARVDLRRAAGVRAGDPDYYQWRAEGRAYVPVFAKRRVIALRGVFAGVEPTGGTTTLPYYRLVQSEGTSRFAGFTSERFRDRRLVLARAEYRWEILQRVSALALFELGEVGPRSGAISLRGAHKSYGGGLRLGLSDESTLRFELAKSVEGLHAVVALGGDF